MKKIITLAAIALAACITFASCAKEDSATVAGDNEVVIDGVVYKLESFIQTEGGAPGIWTATILTQKGQTPPTVS